MNTMNYKKMNYDDIENQVKPDIFEDSTNVDISISDFDISAYHYHDIDDITEKEMKYLENTIIRSSYVYKEYINYLKTELDINTCTILTGLNTKELGISLEFHHYPFNLYTIANTIMKYLLAKNGEVSSLELGEKVMEEHYLGNIGLVPLTKTAHELWHSGNLRIPFANVYGNYERFIEKYKDFIDPESLQSYEEYKKLKPAECEIFNRNKLSKNIIKYNVEYNHEEKE